DDIGFDEGGRAGDGAVDMGLGGQVHYRVRLVFTENAIQLGAVADIDLLKRVARAVAGFGQGFQVAGVGELVDVHHAIRRVANDVTDDRRADEAGAAGDEDFHGLGFAFSVSAEQVAGVDFFRHVLKGVGLAVGDDDVADALELLQVADDPRVV